MEGLQSQSICHHVGQPQRSQEPRRSPIFLAHSGVTRSWLLATAAGWIKTITIGSLLPADYSVKLLWGPGRLSGSNTIPASCWHVEGDHWATANLLLPPTGRQRHTIITSVQRLWGLTLQTAASSSSAHSFLSLPAERCLSVTAAASLWPGPLCPAPGDQRVTTQTHLIYNRDYRSQKGHDNKCQLNAYSLEYPRAALVRLVHSDPLVGHGLAEADLPKGQFLHRDRHRGATESLKTA